MEGKKIFLSVDFFKKKLQSNHYGKKESDLGRMSLYIVYGFKSFCLEVHMGQRGGRKGLGRLTFLFQPGND